MGLLALYLPCLAFVEYVSSTWTPHIGFCILKDMYWTIHVGFINSRDNISNKTPLYFHHFDLIYFVSNQFVFLENPYVLKNCYWYLNRSFLDYCGTIKNSWWQSKKVYIERAYFGPLIFTIPNITDNTVKSSLHYPPPPSLVGILDSPCSVCLSVDIICPEYILTWSMNWWNMSIFQSEAYICSNKSRC